MVEQDTTRGSASRFAQKIGAVAAAAAALLGSGSATAHENDALKGLFDRVSISAPLFPSVQLPRPLVLKSSGMGGSLARGGRGHSSHSSHSSHASHASSSIGGSRPSRASSVPDSSSGSVLESAPKRPAARTTVSMPPRPVVKTEPSQNLAVAAEVVAAPVPANGADAVPVVPAPNPNAPVVMPEQVEKRPREVLPDLPVAPVVGLDLTDPTVRFQLHMIIHTALKDKAFIKDRKFGRTKLYEVGEKIDKFTLFSVDYKEETIQLKDGNNAPILLKKHVIGGSK